MNDLNFSFSNDINIGSGDQTDTDNDAAYAQDGIQGDETLPELFDELDSATAELETALDDFDAGNSDAMSSNSGKGPTPQDFMSQLNDIAGKSEDWSAGEDKLLNQGKRLMNATPEQRQAFLDKAEDLMKGSDPEDTDASAEDLETTEISGREASELEGFVDGLLNDASESSQGTDGADSGEDKSFMDQVDDILAQSQGGEEGPGEKMAREAAKMLEDNPEEDQQAFLDELDKMLNNADGNGDYEKDIDEANDHEGTMLKKMAEAFDELPSDRGDSSDGSSGSESSSGNGSVLSALIKQYGGDDHISTAELASLRAAVDATEESAA